MTDITPKETIANLNHIYGMVAPDIQRSLDVAIKALENQTTEGDLISREALKEAVKNRFDNSEYFPFHFLALIDNAPTVEPERPQGEWIFVHPLQADDGGAYMCSNCKSGDYGVANYYKYCPFCGAEMKGGAE